MRERKGRTNKNKERMSEREQVDEKRERRKCEKKKKAEIRKKRTKEKRKRVKTMIATVSRVSCIVILYSQSRTCSRTLGPNYLQSVSRVLPK